MHGLIALESPPCGMEGTKPQARIDAAFDKTMILLDHIIQIFALPERTDWWELPLLLQCLESRRISRVLINDDDTWGGRMCGAEGLAEETLGGCGIARLTEQKVNGLTRGIDGSIEVIPLLLDLDVRLIDAIGVVRLGEMGTTPLVELRRVALHPPKYSGVIDGDPTFPQQFFDITIAQGLAQIPPYAAHDDLTRKVTPFADWGDIHERPPVI